MRSERATMYLWAALIAAVGLVLILGAHRLAEPLATVSHEVGFAFLVSLVIWLIFEHHLSREAERTWDRRIERVTQNVFQAVLRKDLPKGLLDEANNLVLNSSVIRTGFTVTYTLFDSEFEDAGRPADCVLVEAVMEFSMQNVGTDTYCWNVVLGLPNPIHPDMKRQVRVTDLRVFKGGEAVQFDLQTAQGAFRKDLDGGSEHTIVFRAGMVELQPGEKADFSATYIMAKECEDSEFLKTLFPADGMRVTIFDRAGDTRRVTFAKSVHRKTLESASDLSANPRSKIFRIPGYLLPHQGVLIWWKKKPTEPEPPLPLGEGGATASDNAAGGTV